MNPQIAPESGIYVLKTVKHFYIGLSSNLKKRKYQHFNKLKNNTHQNSRLQNVFNKGYELTFEVLEIVENELLEDKEIAWFLRYSEEHRALTPLNLKDCGSKPTYSFEAKQKMSENKCKNSYNWNKKYNAITVDSNAFEATGTLKEICEMFGLSVKLVSDSVINSNTYNNNNREVFITETLEKPPSLDDIDYMNEW